MTNGRNVTVAEMKLFYGAHQKNFSEDKPILSAAKYRPVIVDSKNIRYTVCRYPRGFPQGGASSAISAICNLSQTAENILLSSVIPGHHHLTNDFYKLCYRGLEMAIALLARLKI